MSAYASKNNSNNSSVVRGAVNGAKQISTVAAAQKKLNQKVRRGLGSNGSKPSVGSGGPVASASLTSLQHSISIAQHV